MTDHPTVGSEPPVVLGSREQLLHLLAEASEIEHTLMCSYLYAAFSLKRAGDDGLSIYEGEAVERWRKAIMAVAVEEMGHLLMVANLTVAVGGRPHFARAAAGELVRLPATDEAPDVHAGMTFTMLRDLDPLLDAVEGVVIREQLMALRKAELPSGLTERVGEMAQEFCLTSEAARVG